MARASKKALKNEQHNQTSPTFNALTAKLLTATGPFPGTAWPTTGPFPETARPSGIPRFRSRQRCLRLSPPVGSHDLSLTKGQVVMLLLDDSGSMFRSETDQEGLRYIAAESVVDLLRRVGVSSLGVIHWGSSCPQDLLLRPTPPNDVRQIDKALRMPESSLGGTNLAVALQFAQSVVQNDVPDLKPNYLVITDGLESLGQSLKEALAELPSRSVRVLLIDRAVQCDAATERAWRSLPLGAFFRLATSDPDDWSWSAAVALFSGVSASYPELPDPSQREYLR